MKRVMPCICRTAAVLAVLAVVALAFPVAPVTATPYDSSLSLAPSDGTMDVICTHTTCSTGNCPKWSRATRCKFSSTGSCSTVRC
jgi:hypothetical protein